MFLQTVVGSSLFLGPMNIKLSSGLLENTGDPHSREAAEPSRVFQLVRIFRVIIQ